KQTITCLKHKKHVLCEKSLASNLKEVKSMIKTAKDNNVLLMEAMRITCVPNIKAPFDNSFLKAFSIIPFLYLSYLEEY
ncbi:Gfo/Idh/MocA family oxidoreductase, partial [Clostridioides difficile]|uniref:Gfo/Idh/MocA family oxidoreductase n=1 Tax=Clostridioides difficile TaxID=1496 RepID=UPI002ED2FCBD